MNSDTTNEKNVKQLSSPKEIDWLKLLKKIYTSKKLILMACGIGAIIGMVIASGTPKEYTARIFIVPESSRRSAFSGISALTDRVDATPSSAIERDAIYSVLYPAIVHSTPFLVRLFDVKVGELKDGTAITLSQYLKERQKHPWWSVITSAPSKLIGWSLSLFREKQKTDSTKSRTDIFQLTREEAGMAGAISSRISIKIKEMSIKRNVTISVTMQDPQVAATVADTVLSYLKEYVTAYRTGKARKMLDYKKKLRAEAQTEYYNAQEKYTRYADINRDLSMLTSRAELTRLRNEMNLALKTYNQAELQVQAAEARVKKETPVLVVIQPAIVPLSPSKPRTLMIFTVCIFLSGAVSIGWVLFGKDFLKNLKKKGTIPASE